MRAAGLPIWLAYRYIRQAKAHGFLSVMANIAVLGLIVGTAALIVVLSVYNGFEKALEDRLLGLIPHIQLYPKTMMAEYAPTVDHLAHADPNIAAVSPNLNTQAMLVAKDPTQKQPVQAVTLFGVDPAYEKNVSLLALTAQNGQGLVQGDLSSVGAGQNIIIGAHLAKQFGLKLGDSVQVVVPKAAQSPAGIVPVSYAFTVSGIFALTPKTEQYIAVTSMDNVQKILQLEHGAGSFRIKLRNVFTAADTAATLQKQYPDWTVYHWQQTHGTIYQTLQMQRRMMGLLLFLIVLVASFNLVSSLVMRVGEQKSSIAILKTLGASPRLIGAVFFWQGFLLSLVGVCVGTGLGLLIALHIGTLSRWVNESLQLGLFDRYFVTELPSVIVFTDVAVVFGLSLIVGALATYYPAKKALRTDPAAALSA